MKKMLFAGAIALAGLVNAQENGLKGTSFVSGSFGLSSTVVKNTNYKTSEFNIIPVVGTFITNDVAIGAGLGYSSSKYENSINVMGTNYTTKQESSAFVFSPMLRKYWGLGEKLYFFGQLDVPMSWGTNKETQNSTITENKFSTFGVNLRPGLDYILNNHWTMETTIGSLGYNSIKPENGDARNTINLGFNLSSVNFGVKYLF